MTAAVSDEPRYPDITVKLSSGTDGNAMMIIGKMRNALRRGGVDDAKIAEFTAEAMDGDYDNVLVTCMRWVNVE